ncbi:hypothetical protein [Polaromonas sp. LjRoot131]|uniref:hypothetical protein n=1 Tax=Polaromonas sp. LjRoot131 TaxID=3342262 RepID=UPI003ECD8A08
MEPDVAAEMKPDTGPQAFAVSFFPSPSPSFLPSALALKVTFASLDIFLPRSKLRCKATSGLPGYFWRIPVP